MINRQKFHNIAGDIRFWIILFFLVRLTGITNPPLETSHNWRQCFTNMVARNFLEQDANIFYPQIDMAGDQSGITGSEFPLFNYLIFVISWIFGFEHWYGRLINLLVSTIGIWFFYQLISRILNRTTAFASTIILLSSIWFSFSRKIMPDTFSVSLMIIGLFCVYKFAVGGKVMHLILFILFSSAGALCKLPSVMFVSLVAMPVFSVKYGRRRKCALIIASLVTAGITFLWYGYWVPWLVNTWHNRLYFPVSISQGIREIIVNLPDILDKFYFSALSSFVAFGCFLAGIYLIIIRKSPVLVWIFALLTLLFGGFMLKAGRIFSMHDYYIIPYVPLMALIAGYALGSIRPLFRNILLIIIAIEGIANQHQDFFIKKSERYKLELENIADKVSRRNDLIIINVDGNPQELYFSHRKGWNIPEYRLYEEGVIPALMQKGAKYLFINQSRGKPDLDDPVVYQDEHFTVYELK
jgi:hypothetical protein